MKLTSNLLMSLHLSIRGEVGWGEGSGGALLADLTLLA